MSDEAKMLLAQLCVANVDRNATNDANVRLRARIRELEEALRPFAREADGVAEFRADYFLDIKDGDEVLGVVAVADFRRARSVLEKATPAG